MLSFPARTLRIGLVALMLVFGIASARLAGDMAGARASGIPQTALLCSGRPVITDQDGNPAIPAHCDACTLMLAALAPVPPVSSPVSRAWSGLAGEVSPLQPPTFATAAYAARAPPAIV